MPGQSLWECVADVVRELRTQRDIQLIDIAYWSRISQGSISRFENHESQPRDLDRLVLAYARVFEMEPIEIMREALERWAKQRGAGADEPTNPSISETAKKVGRRRTDRKPKPQRRRRDADGGRP